ncbi:MAG: hypothetical protein H6740_08490 [Alphaproteobacteria bacterium]|nr:hypothetical protein [Alphaproteobacteria bacterium]
MPLDRSSTLESATLSTAEATELSTFAEAEVSVTGGSTGGGGIQARILCQPAGSSAYYSDFRDAAGVLHIDMTKEVQYT